MKKYALGISAIVAGIVISAFSIPPSQHEKENLINYVWFQVKAGNGLDETLDDSQVNFLAPASSMPPAGSCTGSGYNCVVGFETTQITGGTHLNGTQDIRAEGNQRGTL